jgi:hypothetical protein
MEAAQGQEFPPCREILQLNDEWSHGLGPQIESRDKHRRFVHAGETVFTADLIDVWLKEKNTSDTESIFE